jgi:hypothetical protein
MNSRYNRRACEPPMKASPPLNTSLFSSRSLWITAVLLLFGLGLAIRLYDLTDLPLDFHPTRQLLSALKARGMYYQGLTNVPDAMRDFAIQQWKYRTPAEPEFFERLTAITYRLIGEQLWIARVYSSLFWMIGAVFLYLLGRDLVSSEGALAAASFYLFLPYAVRASRSFQPDPLMVMLIVGFWWAVYRWSRQQTSTKWAVTAGLLGGFAIYIKFVAVFFVIGGGLGAVLGRESIRDALRRPQTWVMVLLGILPGAAYFVYGTWVAGYLGQRFYGRVIPALLIDPSFYLEWIGTLSILMSGAVLMLGLLGLLFFNRGNLRFILGLWAGYLAFGLVFDYHISTHDYYSLPLIPIVALSLAPLADSLLTRLAEAASERWLRTAAYLILLFGLGISLWERRAEFKSVDYRPEVQMWTEVSETIGDANLVALTQDYGSRLAYWGWKGAVIWPTSGDLAYHVGLLGAEDDFEKQFEEITAKKDLFLVTDFDELERQPFLDEKLRSTYPVFAEGDGYVVYALHD